MGLIAVDTETTGLDSYHGCRPFFVSTCTEEGEVRFWEWDVDPFTREPLIPKEDLAEIRSFLGLRRNGPRPLNLPGLVLHNAKFDIRMLSAIGINPPDWSRVHDTLIAHHCLASAESHNLKDLALQYLDITDEDQQALKDATNAARRIADRKGWRIGKVGDAHFPAVKRPPKDGFWVVDTWLPRAVAIADKYPEDHPWWTVLRTYAVLDAERTMGLWWVFREALKVEGLLDQYETRRKLLGITFRMEARGVTVDPVRLKEATDRYAAATIEAEAKAKNLADKKIDNLDSNKQLQEILYSNFKLKGDKTTKTGYSTDKDTLKALKHQVGERSKAFHFLKNLEDFRHFGKAVDYLDGYRLSALVRKDGWLVLHPAFNITGTTTTRFSSQDPNAQNISKQEDFNLREVFGPCPGRVWYSLDFENIEMRIPAYTAGEEDLIRLFEEGGSYHLLISELLHPDLFKKLGPDGFKKCPWYRKVKNGNFAQQYGGMKNTVDAAFGVPGAYEQVRSRFPKITKLSDYWLEHATKHGFVVTLGGYRLQCPKSERGGVIPTTPFNYFTQGSAGWAMILALIRCQEEIDRWNVGKTEDQMVFIILTIHDELVFDFPEGQDTPDRIRKLKALMELVGEDFGFPLPVDVDVIKSTWAKEEPWRVDL